MDIVIVSFHSRDLVLACLDSLDAGAAGVSTTRTVVDNHSGDGIVAAVQARGDGARALDMGRNAGFGTANNRGIALGSGRYVLVLNPDTVVPAGTVATLVDFADAHPEAGVVAPRLVNADGSPQLTARAFPTAAAGLFGRRALLTRLFPGNPWSTRFLLERGRPADDQQPFTPDWVSGAAMLVPRAVVDTVGGFDESFFLFWEDADWCRRIHDAGFQVWAVPSATIVHDEGGTREHGWTPLTIRLFHAGAYRYWTKHHAAHPAHPMRLVAALLLAGRGSLLAARTLLPRHPSDLLGHRPLDRQEPVRA
ncbi:MAG TPA: glycosyltransferase family 2 protein [Propionibacteriaceae bacterium]